jgi:DNA replication and repair protein RecF
MSGFTGSLQLENFRNHERKTIDLNLKTLVIGKNGSGKTSILEALSLLSVATSWKTERDGEVILHGQDFTRVVLGEHQVFLQRSPALKKYRVDGQSKKLQEVLGILPTVLFQPDDAQLVHGSPAYRRATIDRLLSQVVPGYAGGLSVLQKVLKQRNRLLKIAQETVVTEEEFLFWEEQLSSAADLLYRARKDFVGIVGDLVQQEVGILMQELPILSMVYHQSPGNMTGSLQEHYKKNRYKEIAAGVTLYGPHREDVQFTIGGYPPYY